MTHKNTYITYAPIRILPDFAGKGDKNLSGDEIANVNFYAVRP